MDGKVSVQKVDKQTVVAAVLITAGLLLFWWLFYQMGYSSGTYDQRARVERQHYASDAANHLGQDCSKLAGPALRKCTYDVVKSEHETQRQESDLAAQWEAADWTFWAVLVSGTQLIATIIGLIFIKGTLDATWKAVEDTGEATDAMKEQNRLTEQAMRLASDTTRAQLRTYFSSVKERVKVDETKTRLELTYRYKNGGLTPSHDTPVTLTITFISRGKPHSLPHRQIDQHIFLYGMMGPGADNRARFPVTITPEESEAIRKDAAIVMVSATITYRDEFGDRWIYNQNMLVESRSFENGVLYTSDCNTHPMREAEAQQAEGKLNLEGGGEGRPAE